MLAPHKSVRYERYEFRKWTTFDAETIVESPASLLNFYKRLIRVRKSAPALLEGEYTPLAVRSKEYFAFLRITGEQTVLVVLNYSDQRQELKLKVPGFKTARVLFSSSGRSKADETLTSLTVGAFEVLIAELKS